MDIEQEITPFNTENKPVAPIEVDDDDDDDVKEVDINEINQNVRDDEVLMLKSTKGKNKLCLRGHTYFQSSVAWNYTYWNCDSVYDDPHGRRCGGTVITMTETKKVREIRGSHIHLPDHEFIRQTMAMNEIKSLIETMLYERTDIAYQKIIEEQMEVKYSDIIDRLPSKNLFSQMMCRIRRKLNVKIDPNSIPSSKHETASYRDDEILVLPSSKLKGNKFLCIRGHLYQKSNVKRDGKVFYWCCRLKNSGNRCKATILTTSDMKSFVKVRPYHNHPVILSKSIKLIAFEKIRNLVRLNPDEEPNSIVDKFIESNAGVALPTNLELLEIVIKEKTKGEEDEINQAVLDFDLKILSEQIAETAEKSTENSGETNTVEDEDKVAVNPKFQDHQNKCRSCFKPFNVDSTKIFFKQRQKNIFNKFIGIELKDGPNFSKYLCTECDAELKRLAKFSESIGELQTEFNDYFEGQESVAIKLEGEEIDEIEQVIIADPTGILVDLKEEFEPEEATTEEVKDDEASAIRDCYVKLETIDVSKYDLYTEESGESGDDDTDFEKPPPNVQEVPFKSRPRKAKRFEGFFTCDLCGKTYSDRSIIHTHMRCHRFDFSCDACNTRFTTLPSYEFHLKRIHPEIEPTVACQECDQKFHSETTLTNHMKKVHWAAIPCIHEGCNLKFYTVKWMENHHLSVHMEKQPMPCHICGKMLKNKVNLFYHLQGHEKKIYKCEICGEEFTSRSSRLYHIDKKHVKPTPDIKCDFCDQLFFTRRKLYSHKMSKHAERSNICEICSKRFIKKSDLRLHLENVHSDVDLNLPCDICENKFFKTKSKLAAHMTLLHKNKAGGRYSCETCGKKCATSGKLRHHTRTVHEGKRFSCVVPGCTTTFSHQNGVERHLKLSSAHKLDPGEMEYYMSQVKFVKMQ